MRSRLIERLVSPTGLRAHFQPIFDLRSRPHRIVAVEGLTRGPEQSNFATPDVLFEFARRKREEPAVDRAAVRTILKSAREFPSAWKLHLNVHASTIVRDEAFGEFLVAAARENRIEPSRLVVELLEHWAADVSETPLLAGLARLRSAGVQVALDDVGAGVANLGLILMTEPTLLKIDRSLVQGLAGSRRQNAALRSIGVLAREIGAELVAEGIEEATDLEALRQVGIELAQGYFLARPTTAAELCARLPEPDGAAPRAATLPLALAAG